MANKWCIVSHCKNTSIKFPQKVFISVPRNPETRKLWAELAGRSYDSFKPRSNVFMCEDHFDMEKDVMNYMQYKMGFCQKIRLSDVAVPSKLYWKYECEIEQSDAGCEQEVILEQKDIQSDNVCDMDELDVTIDTDFNIMEVCCACLSKNPSNWLINITADAYTNITGIELTEDLPNQMCDSCIKLLNQADDFRTKCIESNKWLIKAGMLINSQSKVKKFEQETDINSIFIKEEEYKVEEIILPDRNEVVEIEIQNTNIKQEIVEEEELLLPKETAGNEQLFTIKTESLDSDMKGDTSGVKDLDSCKLQNTNEKIKKIPPNNILVNDENIKAKGIVKKKKSFIENTYKCNMCIYSSPRKGDIVRHLSTHTDEKTFSCNICYKSFKQKINLVVHLRKHTGEKTYKCNMCIYSSPRKGDLVRHLRTHTDEKTFSCNICCKSFKQKMNLVDHLRKHTGVKPYKCNMCHYSSSWNGDLVRHFRTHTDEKTFSCNICYKSFKQKFNLVVHLRKHTGERPYKCNMCNYSSIRKGDLISHLRTHTDEKTFSCNICHKSYKQKINLVVHLRKHTGEKPYKCGACNRSFIQKVSLDRHLRTHTGEKPYKSEVKSVFR